MKESRAEAKGATENTQIYELVVQSRVRGKIDASRRIPVYTGSKGDAKEMHTVALGTIVECTADDRETLVRVDCAFESSYAAREQPPIQTPYGFLPTINSRQASVAALVPIGQEVRVARMDDPSSGNLLEIFLSAERFADPSQR